MVMLRVKFDSYRIWRKLQIDITIVKAKLGLMSAVLEIDDVSS
jgi:hypothetical protein